jgi:hypothetical protein
MDISTLKDEATALTPNAGHQSHSNAAPHPRRIDINDNFHLNFQVFAVGVAQTRVF